MSKIPSEKQIYVDLLSDVFNQMAPVIDQYAPIMDQKAAALQAANPGMNEDNIRDLMICDPSLLPVHQAQKKYFADLADIRNAFIAEFGEDAQEELNYLTLVAARKLVP